MALSIIQKDESGASVRAKLNDRWQVLAQSSVAIACPNDTTEDVLVTILVPAGAMGANGRLKITAVWSCNNNANNKTTRVRFGGTAYSALNIANTLSLRDQREIVNRANAASQIGGSSGGTIFGSTSGALITSVIDTTLEVSLTITGQKATASDTLMLESYLVELYGAI